MKIQVNFAKSETGEVTATIALERGFDDPAIISIDGMARTFESSKRMEVNRLFGHKGGNSAGDWAETAVADIKHQIDEYRTSIPKDYKTEY